jgi:hypothetical protein
VKNPVVLAILNFVFIGLGTALLGKRPVTGLVATIGAGVMLRYEELRIAPLQTGVLTIHWVLLVTGLTLLGLATAADVYREAKAVS